ncbi:methyltransferase family protein [Bradyrhizobium sp. RDT10]
MEATSAAPDRLVKLGLAFRDSKTLLSAVELGVFTLLAQEPLELNPLAKQSGVDARGARDFFDALVALGLLERDESGHYSNTADATQYLDRNKPSYIGGELELANARQFGPGVSSPKRCAPAGHKVELGVPRITVPTTPIPQFWRTLPGA